MSFSTAHNDFLDPDRHLGFAGDEFGDIAEEIRDVLDKQDDVTVDVIRCDDEGIHCSARVTHTFAGNEVCLNLPDETDDAAWEQAREAYLDQANEVIIGTDVPGEWDGQDWVMDASVEFTVPWENDDDDPDLDALTKAIIEQGEEALAHIERELVLADQILDLLSGWSSHDENGDLVRCPKGQPGPEAAWMQAA